jgi:hypothetical protein
MKRKVFILSSIIFILVAVLGTMFLLPNKAEADTATDENSITWSFTVSGRYLDYLVYSSGNIPADGKVVVPSTLNLNGIEYTVRSVGYSSGTYKSMFYSASSTNRNKIKEIVLPDTVTTVQNYGFYNIPNLTSVDFGEGITSLGNWIIGYTSITEVVLPNSLTYIDSRTFATYNYNSNYNITKFYIGDKLNLSYVSSLISYTPNVTAWGANPNSEKYMEIDGELYSKDGKTLHLIRPKYTNSTYTVNEDVTAIGDYCFYNNSYLRTVTLNDNIKTIGDYAFGYCSNLGIVDLPSSLISIGNGAFSDCRSMTGELSLPDGLTNIGSSAFSGCYGFTGDLVIPDSVATMGSNAFYNCSGLDGNLVVGDGVIAIESRTFYRINNLKRITLGSGIRQIKSNAFSGLKDFWINCLEGEVYLESNYGGSNSNPFPHYLNGTHRVTIGTSEGIRVINTETNAEVTSGNYECETSFRYKVVIDPGYNYPDLKIVEINNNDLDNIVTHNYVQGQEYEFSTLLRDRKIYIESIKEGNDLSLRTFITDVNYTTVSKPRIPSAELNKGDFKYVHTKYPLRVENNDDVTFKIRIFNESLSKLSADEITVYVPDGMSFDPENIVNSRGGWTTIDGKTIKTTKLEGALVPGYYGNGIISYKDIDIVLKVTDSSAEEDLYKTVFAEITRESAPDADSTPGNVVVSQNYMIDEILDSNANSTIASQEDDDDFDTVVLNAKFRVEYAIRINKIDSKTDEVLKGAKFKLTSFGTNELEVTENSERVLKTFSDGETIATATSDENGTVDFGGLVSYGEGENEYLVEEIDAPSGYLTNIGKKMKVRVVKSIIDKEKGTYGVKVFCGSTDYAIDTSTYEFTPVKTAEQLAKIGSGETVNVDGMDYEYNIDTNYKLIDDIDLAGINWTPIKNEIKGVFDGNGHKIKNLTIVSTNTLPYSEVGLISTFSGIVENLTFENPNIHFVTFEESAITNSGYTGVGCFAGVMRQGGIYNCKTTVTEGATASITASADNLGGIVGHTVPEGLVTVIDCENNLSIVGQETEIAGVTIKNKNVGGIIGCALGSISVQDSTNNGYVQAQEYNAGGLVGFVNPSDYREMLLSAGYDEDNKRIDLLVENEAAEGQYNLTLEVRDRKTQALIGGATYEIDKVEDMVMTQLLDTGSLKLFDKVIEYTGRDVYFLTEDETIEGYSKLNGIIKVVIERYWDNDANEYKVRAEATIVSHKEYEEFTENREVNNDDVKGEEFDRGSVFTDANIVNANWNGKKVEFRGNTNNGTVQSMYMNAAGMLGTSYGLVEFENNTNNGTILSQTKAGGILSELRTVNGGEAYSDVTIETTQNSTGNSEFENCTNNGDIHTTGIGYYVKGSEGGILSEVTGYAIISNSTNNGYITSSGDRQVGGIVGQVTGGIEIKDSINKGEIYSCDPDSQTSVNNLTGGIMGQLRCMSGSHDKLTYVNTYARIKGCKNYANITGTCATAGILAASSGGNEVTITNCEVKGTEEAKTKILMRRAGGCAGILALDGCKHTTLRDNKVENCIVEVAEESFGYSDTYNSCAGILADVDHYAATSGMSFKSNENGKIETITVNNNTVKNCSIIDRDKECGGIVATTNLGSDSTAFTSINNCLVENTEVLNYNSGNTTYNISGGIFAGGGYGNGTVAIDYCLVKNTTLIKSNPGGGPGPGQATIGGIFGRGNYIRGITITNSDFTDSYLYDNALDSTSGSPAGIFGTCYGMYGDLVIRGCNIINSTIREYGQNVGGFIGGVESVSGDVIVEDCNAIETNISREIWGDYGTVYNDVGYVMGFGMSINDIKLSNINIIGKDLPKGSEGRTTIYSDGANIGAIIGDVQSYHKLTAENINVKNIDIVNTIGEHGYPSLDAAQIGGFAGVMQSGCELTGFNLENCDVRGNKVFNSGGITATLFGTGKFKDINIKDTNITTGLMLDDGISTYGHAAGLVSEQNSSASYENCNIENCKISCGCVGASGMISCNHGKTTVKDCTIKNLELIDTWENPQGEVPVGNGYQHYRPFGGVISVGCSEIEIDNVSVDGFKCHGKYAHIGAIAGYAGSASIKNCTAKNVDIYSERNISGSNGAVGGIIADGCYLKEFKNNKISDAKIVTTTHLLGGMIGTLIPYNGLTLSDCEVDNVELIHKNMEHYGGYGASLPSMGGFAAQTNSKCEFKNITVKNSTMKAENPSGIPLQVGGILGHGYANIVFDNVNVINTEIENLSAGSCTGGLAGMGVGLTIKNSAVTENTKIKGNHHVSGIVGLGVITVNDTKLLNSRVEALTGNGLVAGVLAIGNERESNGTYKPSTIKGVEIKNTNIVGLTGENMYGNHAGGIAGTYAGTIENVTMKNVNITTGGLAAGVVAVQENVGSISDVELNDVNPTSANTLAAGIAAVSNSNISDVKIINSEVKGKDIAGGIAATNNSATISGAEVNNVKVTSSNNHAGGIIACTSSKIENANVINSTITGNGHAGGIAATSYGEIKSVKVEGSTVKGNAHAGGIVSCTNGVVNNATVKDTSVTGNSLAGGVVGTTNAEISLAKVEGSTVKSETLHAGGIAACTIFPVTNSSVKDSTIITLSGSYVSGNTTNPTCLGGLVGAGVQDPTTGELKPNLSTSTVENNTLTGATGTLVGKYIGAPKALNDQLVAGETTTNPDTNNTSGAPLNSMAPTSSNTQASPKTMSLNAQPKTSEDQVDDSDKTTNTETTSGTKEDETETESNKETEIEKESESKPEETQTKGESESDKEETTNTKEDDKTEDKTDSTDSTKDTESATKGNE